MEIIYILINEAMPGYVKIGRTTNLDQRIRSLDTTGIPLPFECFYAATVKDAGFVEARLHDAFMDRRVRSSREFFRIAPERAVSALRLAEIENVTPKKDIVETEEDQQALNQARAKRPDFKFKMVDIPVGSELEFSRDKNVKAKVLDNVQIELNGKTTTLSRAAQKLLGLSYGVQGPAYWMYDGETLDERRKRMEGEE